MSVGTSAFAEISRQLGECQKKVDGFEAAMESCNKADWSQSLKELAARIKGILIVNTASVAEDLQRASIELCYMADCFTLKANFLPRDLTIKEAYEIIKQVQGIERNDKSRELYDRIEAWLAETKRLSAGSTVPIE